MCLESFEVKIIGPSTRPHLRWGEQYVRKPPRMAYITLAVGEKRKGKIDREGYMMQTQILAILHLDCGVFDLFSVKFKKK